MTTLKLNPEVAEYDPVSFGAEASKVNGSVISPTQLSVQEALFVQLQQLNGQIAQNRYQIDYVLSPRLQTVAAIMAQYLSLPTVPNDYHLLAQEQRTLRSSIKAYQDSIEALTVNLKYTQKAYQHNKHEEFVVPEDPITLAADGSVIVREPEEEEVDDGTDRWVTWVGGDRGDSQSAEVTEMPETMGGLADVAEVEDENCMDETDSKEDLTDGMAVTDGDGHQIEDYIEDVDDDNKNKTKQKDDDSEDAKSNSIDGEETRDQEQRKKKKRKRRKRGKKKTTSKAKQKS